MHSLDWIQNRPAPQEVDALDSLDLAKLLLERGARADPALTSAPPGWKGDAVAAQNTFAGAVGAGTTPFIRAAKNADLPAMRLLLEKGADPNSATRSRVTALMALVGGLGRKYRADLQVSADEEKNAVQAATLLLDRGADVNTANEAGQTVLHAAAMVGANGIVRFLVDRGARLDAKNGQGRTPRDEALRGMANVDGAQNDPASGHGGIAGGIDGEAGPAGRSGANGGYRPVIGRLVGGLTLALATAAAAGAAGPADRNVRDGVYSADQAQRGKSRYTASCASCHLGDLSGTLSGDSGAPPLRGEAFVTFIEGWDTRRLFDYIRTTMPADDPATLSDHEYLDILAYLFQANEFPAGARELGLSELDEIRIRKK